MSERILSRLAALLMIAVFLFWNSFPIISCAGSFITPGKPINPGKALTPGQPIKGGQFIIPGQVYNPGKAIATGEAAAPGKTGGASGQPILPKSPYQNGTFIIPNAPQVPPGSLYWQLRNLETGGALQGGTPINGGNSSVDGQGPSGGKGINGVQGPNGGQSINGSQAPNGGQGLNGGQAQNGGQGINGGQGLNGGQSLSGGAPNGGKGINGGRGPNSGQSQNGGSLPENISSSKNEGSTSSQTSEGGWGQTLFEFYKNKIKKFGTDVIFAADNIAQGVVASIAGYKFIDHPKKGGYKFLGNRKSDNKIMQWFLDRYSKDIKNNKRNYNDFEKKEFLKSKGLAGFKETLKKSIRDSWIPFYKKETQVKIKGQKIPKIETKWAINKDFFKVSKMLKGNGVTNWILTTGQTIYDYTLGSKKDKFNTTDFYADLSTDVTIGAGTTLVSAIASSIAVGAVGGSVIPGAGTIAGAAAGLIVGIGSYFFMNSRPGKALRSVIRNGFKWGYDKLSSAGKAMGSKISEVGAKLKSGLKKLGGMFG
ncbi:hypothetical protein PB1_05747 [Bacillus methanolicus PB1]|uniref:Uncharacterized protein n=1 Tax=Bacillus methanolicus PB1 TaxID=997296 RepID=I3E023_BACMT|nr:hypothetical protein [Bacillus methanolicus]EIJ79844.1 hypothetical protein PB1_05747 [Bacillus methanolicus PB1]